jgi:hypothetical protein
MCGLVCGCGRPDHFWEVVRDTLDACDAGDLSDQAWKQRSEKFQALFGPYDQEVDQFKDFALYVVGSDYAELMEHGSSVGGSWLTDDGREALAFLRQWGTEWTDTPNVEFVDDGGCYHGAK